MKYKKNRVIRTLYYYFRCLLTIFSPKLNTVVTYRISKGRKINLKNPVTFDEKISWLKINNYNRNSLVKRCADKFEVRKYLIEQGYSSLLIDIYAVYEDVGSIQWEQLPNKFVFKWNVGCGGNILCYDINLINKQKIRKKLKQLGRKQYHLPNAELQYKNVRRMLIIEKMLGDGHPIDDYKFYCYNGKAEYVMICVGRNQGHAKYYFYNQNWELMKFNKDGRAAPQGFKIEKSPVIDYLFQVSCELAQPFPFVRIDYYIVDSKPYFGEFTFTPAGGIDSNLPHDTDVLLGKLLNL